MSSHKLTKMDTECVKESKISQDVVTQKIENCLKSEVSPNYSITESFVQTMVEADDDEIFQYENDFKKKCYHCGLDYTLLLVHIKLAHSNKQEHRCMICGLPYYNENRLLEHLFNHSNSNILCYWCEDKFDTCEQLLDHIEKHPSAHIYFCTQCKNTFATLNRMLAHLEMCLPELKCPVCNDIFSFPKSLANHYRSQHSGTTIKGGLTRVACKHCGKVFSEIKNYRAHMRNHLNIKLFECDACNNKFVSKKALKQHIYECHMPEKKMFMCPECGLSFHSKCVLDAHTIKSHTTEPVLQCEYCKKQFNYKHVLKEHTKKISCEVCGENLPCNDLYQLHLENHVPTCNICFKTYSTFPALRRHMSFNHKDLRKGQGEFQCEVCCFVTLTARNLMKHKRRLHALYTINKESLEKKRNTMKQQKLMFKAVGNRT